MKNVLSVICCIVIVICIAVGAYFAFRILTSDLPVWLKFVLLK